MKEILVLRGGFIYKKIKIPLSCHPILLSEHLINGTEKRILIKLKLQWKLRTPPSPNHHHGFGFSWFWEYPLFIACKDFLDEPPTLKRCYVPEYPFIWLERTEMPLILHLNVTNTILFNCPLSSLRAIILNMYIPKMIWNNEII